MQVDPIKPALKAPGTERLKLEYDELLSSSAFQLNLRRYIEGLESDIKFVVAGLGRGLHSSSSQLNLSRV